LLSPGISAASGAALVWATSHHIDAGISVPIISGLALVVSTAISGFAATQGVQIPIINKDQTNGVSVVKANTGGQVVNAPLA
jgi:hypothetical protein